VDAATAHSGEEAPPLTPAAPAPPCPDGDAASGCWLGCLGKGAESCWDVLWEDLWRSGRDHANFYTWETLAELAPMLAGAGVLANTSADRDIRFWYQEHVRTPTSSEIANVARYSGEFWLTLPLFFGAAVTPRLLGEEDGVVADWGNQSLRALAVGAAPMGILSAILGAERPAKGDSDWRLFHHVHGVSGHTFMGAVPFLTAAALSDDCFWRSSFVAGSLLVGWTRLDMDRHYLSQIILGWGMAYLAVAAVHETETGERWFRLLPLVSPDGVGVGVWVDY
jgi:hypothetical protein